MSRGVLWQHNTAQLVSYLTSPVLVALVSLALLVDRYAGSTAEFYTWFGLGAALLVGPGFCYTAWTWHKGHRFDLDITSRRDRIIPLFLSSVGAIVGSFLVATYFDNERLLLISYIVVSVLVSLTIVTLAWKISFHTATSSALVTLFVLLTSWQYLWLYLILLPIAWSRLSLKQHTLAQLIAGSISGAMITAVIWLLFS